MTTWRKAAPGPFRRDETITDFLRDSSMDPHDLVETAPRAVGRDVPRRPDVARVGLPAPDGRALRSTTVAEARAARASRWPTAAVSTMTAVEVATVLSEVFAPEDEPVGEVAARRPGYPSPGRAYAVVPWVWAPSVSPSTVGRYDPATHAVEVATPTSVAALDAVTPATRFGSRTFGRSGLVVFLVGDVHELAPRYGALALRLLLLEAGHVGAALQTAATVAGRDAMPLGGVYDDLVTDALRLVDGEHCLYCWSIG